MHVALAAFNVGSLAFTLAFLESLRVGPTITFPLAARVFATGTVGGFFLCGALELQG